MPLDFVEKVAKLKPAKQYLADAIHQNGGWVEGGEFAAQDKDGQEGCAVWFYSGGRPYEHNDSWYPSGNGDAIYGKHISCDKPFVNWNQTVLSRDEYLAAYPEQVKVEVRNETQHKVEVEITSESEMTINVSDWHKNGELPPVGEVVMINSTNPNDYWAHHVGAELTVVAHDNDARGCDIAVYRFVGGDGYNEYHGLVAHAFKPLRTERDKAIDEMIDCLGSRWANCEEIAVHLYENGYRKEVK